MTSKVSLEKALELAKEVGLNLEVVPLDEWRKGIEVELEHGIKYAGVPSVTNVTSDDWLITAKIALAHLIEYPDYYHRLEEMEKEAKEEWEGKSKGEVIISSNGVEMGNYDLLSLLYRNGKIPPLTLTGTKLLKSFIEMTFKECHKEIHSSFCPSLRAIHNFKE